MRPDHVLLTRPALHNGGADDEYPFLREREAWRRNGHSTDGETADEIVRHLKPTVSPSGLTATPCRAPTAIALAP